jgi:hypothetical protein
VARKKKLPWNHDLKIPGYEGEPPHVIKPSPEGISPSHSTPGAPVGQWQCLRCEQIRDGLDPIVPDHFRLCPYRGTGRDPEPMG